MQDVSSFPQFQRHEFSWYGVTNQPYPWSPPWANSSSPGHPSRPSLEIHSNSPKWLSLPILKRTWASQFGVFHHKIQLAKPIPFPAEICIITHWHRQLLCVLPSTNSWLSPRKHEKFQFDAAKHLVPNILRPLPSRAAAVVFKSTQRKFKELAIGHLETTEASAVKTAVVP